MTFWENILLRKLNILHANWIKYNVFTDRVRINQEASPFLEILPFFHSSLVKISHILKAMIFQFRIDMLLRPNNEKTTSDFIMCVCVYSKYIYLQNKSKTNDFRYQISRLFDLLKVVYLSRWQGICCIVLLPLTCRTRRMGVTGSQIHWIPIFNREGVSGQKCRSV